MLLCICFTLLVYCMDMWLLKSSFVILHKLEKKTASNSHNYILLVSAESFQCKDCYGQGNVDFHLDEVSCVFYVVNFDTYCFPSVALADLEGASLPGPLWATDRRTPSLALDRRPKGGPRRVGEWWWWSACLCEEWKKCRIWHSAFLNVKFCISVFLHYFKTSYHCHRQSNQFVGFIF